MNASGYNQGINSAKKSSQEFQQGVQTVSTGIKSAFTSMLGVVGAGVTVFEGVKKTIESTQFTADAFEKSMAQGKSAVDYFFISLSSGDFSGFLQGLRDSITTAGELAETLDVLGDTRRGLDITSAKNQSQLTDLALVYKDKTGKYSDDDRKAAYEQAKGIMEGEAEAMYQTYVQEVDATLNNFSALSGLEKEKIQDIIENYGDYVDDFNAIAEKLASVGGRNAQIAFTKFLSGSDRLYAELYMKYGKLTDEKLDQLKDSLVQQYNAENNIKNVELELIRIYNELFKIQGTGNKKVIEDLDTIKGKEIERQIALEKQQKLLLNQIGLDYDTQYLKDNAPKSIPGEIKNPANEMGLDSDSYTNNADNIIDKNKELEGSFNRLTAVNQIVGDSFLKIAEDGKITMAELTAAVMQSVMQIIIGKMAETSAFIASDSVKNWGWAGIALASVGIGLVSSLFSGIMSDAGNFANSGVVGGNQYFGDRMIAHVNSGEMFLNRGDTANLFDIIKSGGAGAGQVEFVLRGDRLEGAQNNNRKIRNSYRGSYSNRRY